MATILDSDLNWKTYPCDLPHLFCVAEGESQRKALQDDASRLFSGRDDVEVWEHNYMDDGITEPLIS